MIRIEFEVLARPKGAREVEVLAGTGNSQGGSAYPAGQLLGTGEQGVLAAYGMGTVVPLDSRALFPTASGV